MSNCEIVHPVGFYYTKLSRCTVLRMSNYYNGVVRVPNTDTKVRLSNIWHV